MYLLIQLKNKLDIENNPGLSILDLPEKLPGSDSYDSYIDVNATLAGFGFDYLRLDKYDYPHGNSSGQLHKATVLIVDSFQCNKRYEKHLLDSQICARTVEHDDSIQQGTCYVSPFRCLADFLFNLYSRFSISQYFVLLISCAD